MHAKELSSAGGGPDPRRLGPLLPWGNTMGFNISLDSLLQAQKSFEKKERTPSCERDSLAIHGRLECEFSS